MKRRSQLRKNYGRRIPIMFSIIVLLGFIALGILLELDRPRQEAEVVATVESAGGKVVHISWGQGFRVTGPSEGYIDVLFDGDPSRCSLTDLQDDPPIFKCTPEVNR